MIRPGRLDLHFKFEKASQKQAGELFKKFYPLKETTPVTEKEKHEYANGVANYADAPSPTTPINDEKPSYKLTESELSYLSAQFASLIPPGEFSMAALQGYLMQFKSRPRDAVDGVLTWAEKERKEKEEWEKAKRERELEEHQPAPKEEGENKASEEGEKADNNESDQSNKIDG